MSIAVLDGIGFPLESRHTSPPPLRPAGPDRESSPPREERGAESLVRERISRLVGERHELRAQGATHGELEHNRLGIVTAQHELGRILIARHQPG
jgi:hypothetical protein